MTYFLRFPNESAWTSAATAAGFFSEPDEDGNTTLAAYTNDRAIDVVGTITRGGKYGEDGKVLVKPTILPGFHINFAGTLPDGWDDYLVEPANPYRVFA
jgi:hypothetical protein